MQLYLLYLRLFLAGLIAVSLYWSGLSGDFFFDDEINIQLNKNVHMTEFSIRSVIESLTSGITSFTGRPVAQLTFSLNHYASGLDPFAFKATNLAIHLTTALLVFFIARRLLGSGVFAGFAAMLWLLHPIQLTSVLYVVQRMTSLSTLFLLAGFLMHMSGREQGGRRGIVLLLLAWFVCWPLSFLSKEIGVLLPLFVLAWEVIIRRSKTTRLDYFARAFATAVGLLIAAVLIYTALTNAQWLLGGYTTRSFSLAERLLTECRVLWFYLGLIVFPQLDAFALHHDDILLSTGLLTPWTTLPSLIGLAGLVWLAWRTHLKAPLLAFGILWYLIGHSVESTVLSLEIAHEHRNYQPLFGLVIIAGWALAKMVEHSGWQKTLGITLALGMMASFSITTALRAHQYGDELRRTQIEAEYHPNSSRAHYEAGDAIVKHLMIPNAGSPRYYFARRHYEIAGELDPNYKVSWLGLINLNCMVKQAVEKEWIDELVKRLNKAIVRPDILNSIKEMAILGKLCLTRKEIGRLFTAAIENPLMTPNSVSILHSWQADYLMLAVHDLPAAQSELNKSLTIEPNNVSTQLKWAQIALLQGHKEDARGIMDRLEERSFTRSEREIVEILLKCLDVNGFDECTIK